MEDRAVRSLGRGERGFALILAILSLMLLTFLGLTLATTTSTELQIATNYRWSQQALYNAEAGLEAARIILSSPGVVDPTAQWLGTLPAARPGPWLPGAAPAPVEPPQGRDFHMQECDVKGNIGYGLVLADGLQRYENFSAFQGQGVNGAFTIWIRRPLVVNNSGEYSDDPRDNALVIVAEGVAPYTGAASAFTRARQAVRVLETTFNLVVATAGEPCGLGKQQGQEGGSPMGENFNPCANVTPGAGGTMENVFGGAGAGNLSSTGVE
jgi:hypothetical protein